MESGSEGQRKGRRKEEGRKRGVGVMVTVARVEGRASIATFHLFSAVFFPLILGSFCFRGVFKGVFVVSKLPVFVALLFCLVFSQLDTMTPRVRSELLEL